MTLFLDKSSTQVKTKLVLKYRTHPQKIDSYPSYNIEKVYEGGGHIQPANAELQSSSLRTAGVKMENLIGGGGGE